MTTIILSILGILLAAAAALMVVFYGGSAFEDGSVGAQANTLQNAASNVQSASSMFRMTTGAAPTAMTDLTTGGQYLSAPPSVEGVTAGTATISSGYYEVTAVPAEVCLKVNQNVGVNDDAATVTNIPTARPTAKVGCFGTSPNYTFFGTL